MNKLKDNEEYITLQGIVTVDKQVRVTNKYGKSFYRNDNRQKKYEESKAEREKRHEIETARAHFDYWYDEWKEHRSPIGNIDYMIEHFDEIKEKYKGNHELIMAIKKDIMGKFDAIVKRHPELATEEGRKAAREKREKEKYEFQHRYDKYKQWEDKEIAEKMEEVKEQHKIYKTDMLDKRWRVVSKEAIELIMNSDDEKKKELDLDMGELEYEFRDSDKDYQKRYNFESKMDAFEEKWGLNGYAGMEWFEENKKGE